MSHISLPSARFAVLLGIVALSAAAPALHAADALPSKSTYAKEYGKTKGGVNVDPAKDLQRYPAIAPKDAIATWKVKPGFRLELVAHEPQVRDPVAISFDERGRMFVAEMIDYSEMRDAKPHLGRISMLEDKDGDGFFESSVVFADDLAWPTGLICANGGVYVISTPDIIFLKDTTGSGRADLREVTFTGFGTGLKLLNVQGLANCPQWGLDNRIHIQAGGGNRGRVKCLKRPDLPDVELGGRDFWFDPRTLEFGLEAGGAQFGMSFDNYGRKFACSNSDHLQYFLYDDRYASRNPAYSMPPARQSIAADGGAAEVFRISPDEPWRIVRTRWRIAGVVKGAVEGGGRVSGYFTGASGTTVYRGDAYGPAFLNNTFSGDAGGQLVHRKIIHPDGASLVGKRPDDEQGFEFAASSDTWVRVVNFANAPDGCLHIIDMYREVIEHPWSIPDEIKKHLDLNSGNDRGRIYRIVPSNPAWRRRASVNLADLETSALVMTLGHPNGWHRDTATRLLYERQDGARISEIETLVRETKDPLAKLHELAVLDGLGALREPSVIAALSDEDPRVRERGIILSEKLILARLADPASFTDALPKKLAALVDDADQRVRFQLTLSLGTLLERAARMPDDPRRLTSTLGPAFGRMAVENWEDKWISVALLGASPDVVTSLLFEPFTIDPVREVKASAFVAKLIEMQAASRTAGGHGELIEFILSRPPNPLWLRAMADGFRRAGLTIEEADRQRQLSAIFAKAALTVADPRASEAVRLDAIEILSVNPAKQWAIPLAQCLSDARGDALQTAAIRALAQQGGPAVAKLMLDAWPRCGPKAKEAALAALLARPDRATMLLDAIQAGSIAPSVLSATQIQGLVQGKDAQVSALATKVLAAVLPQPRAQVLAKFQPALAMKGDASRGREIYTQRCASCHRVGDQGIALGPDLITVKTKGRDGVLSAIVEPHKEVAPQFIAYSVTTKDGRAFTGFIAKDDASGVTLKLVGGIEQIILRSEIKGTASNGQSLMPEGLEAGLEPQAMADLLTFIEELK